MSLFSFVCHPVTLAAVAVMAIGVVIYEIVNQQEEGNHSYQGRKRPSSPSSHASSVSSYEDIRDGVRRRKQNETKAKTCSLTTTNSQNKVKSSEKPTHKFDEEDYCQNVCDKIGNDVKNLNKDDDKKTFQKTIDYQLDNTSVDVEEIKVINIPTSNESRECPQNILSSNICKQESNPTNINDPCCSTQNTVANDGQILTETGNPFCMACEEVLANAVTYPCKHCYLCINCAAIIHRIYKKCNLCDSEIEYFQPLEK